MIHRMPSHFTGASFSDAVVIHLGMARLIYVSGQVGNDECDTVTASKFDREVELCFRNVRRSLGGCGATMGDVVRITAYMTKLADYGIYARSRALEFRDSLPASVTVEVSGLLANAKIELDAVAFVRGP